MLLALHTPHIFCTLAPLRRLLNQHISPRNYQLLLLTGSNTGGTEVGSSVSYATYTGDFTEKVLTVRQTWAQEPAGYDRTATAYLPETPASSGKLPVVIDLHGFGGRGTKRWKDIGDQIIFVGADGYCTQERN